MPLLKLWNSLRGRSARTAKQEIRPNRETVPVPVSAVSSAAASSASAAASEPPVSRRKRKRGLFGGGPHAALLKAIKSVQASTVLEISVGDGSRAVALSEVLGDFRYVGIDQFELVAGATTLKQFHRVLRASRMRPQVFPDTIDRGLMRVAHTVGTVDLVLISASPEQWQTPRCLQLLSRVTHAETVITYRDGESWLRFEQSLQSDVRRAA